ncbi:MAG: hypothetical protein NTV55_07235 [Planctomycetota bacterium]|nr:hypothetical protein [Planctomycetota bacterium]
MTKKRARQAFAMVDMMMVLAITCMALVWLYPNLVNGLVKPFHVMARVFGGWPL